MGQQKLWTGMVVGALIGGTAMLFDRETREYVMNKSCTTGRACRDFAKHPSELIHSVRLNYEELSQKFNEGADTLLRTLNKLEEILNKVSDIDKEVEKQLRAVDGSQEAS
ncbi:YtxH domain-containing protein [Halobacillus salinarum]|uniref:YtxH domain-containing protein n=1 Tax=Halobacillus salinarum TaxID=2932257 RepID=A0ABY4EID0_9BACI|nr:YtxH domain-containing protein [Halobacillus salinarum]UOQ43846.1 YtxH domain-containing protein [Halobacillus salinarum]